MAIGRRVTRTAVAAIAFLIPITTLAITVGRNINMVSGTTLPGGDPYLQRQDEPAMAVSLRNPMHLMAGANDYRTVDMPGLPDGEETGDASLGVFKSVDGGQTWYSTLVPGLSPPCVKLAAVTPPASRTPPPATAANPPKPAAPPSDSFVNRVRTFVRKLWPSG